MIQRDDLMWLAGLIEGEGWFSPQRGYPRLGISMTDRDVIDRVARLWGVKVFPKKSSGKPQHLVQVGGAAAIGWAFTLYPYLGQRRRTRIRDMVAVWKQTRPFASRTHCPSGHPYAGANLRVEVRSTGKARRCKICARAAVKRWEAKRAV